jgi:hypothetical protein
MRYYQGLGVIFYLADVDGRFFKIIYDNLNRKNNVIMLIEVVVYCNNHDIN